MALAKLECDGGGVGRIILCDPADRNSIDDVMCDAIATNLREAFDDKSTRAIVIGPKGPNFSVGGNIDRLASHPAGQSSHALMLSVGNLALLIEGSPKPIISAVRGHCIGAGAGLALLSDCLISERSASIGFPYLKIGLVPDFGISWSLPRRIGIVRARQALVAGAKFSGSEAFDLGIVDELADDDAVWEVALSRARKLAKAPVAALRQLRLMMRNPPSRLSDALEAEALNQAICFGSSDVVEGISAFKEKRPANFADSGRGTDENS